MKERAPLKDSWVGGASVCGRQAAETHRLCTTIPERRDEAAQKSRQAEGRKRAPRGREEEEGGRVREGKEARG